MPHKAFVGLLLKKWVPSKQQSMRTIPRTPDRPMKMPGRSKQIAVCTALALWMQKAKARIDGLVGVELSLPEMCVFLEGALCCVVFERKKPKGYHGDPNFDTEPNKCGENSAPELSGESQSKPG